MRTSRLDTQDARRMVACLVDIAALLRDPTWRPCLEAIEERLKHGADH